MSSSKNSLLRYKTIDNCLTNRTRRWTLEDLMQACQEAMLEFGSGIGMASRRTLQMDLQFMRSEAGYAAPIVVVEKKYYTYEDPTYSITKAPINKEEVAQLGEAVRILKQLTDLAPLQGMETVVSRLEDYVTGIQTQQAPVIYFERNDLLTGLSYIPLLYQAIRERKVLQIDYQSFASKAPRTYFFSPYVLKEYRNRWFLFGRHNRSRRLSNFALDRIVKAEIAPREPYYADPSFHPETYFEDLVGVTKPDEEPVVVRFWASAEQTPYILTKPIHRSQIMTQKCPDGSAVFQIRVRLNNELIRELISFAEGLCVLSPVSLARTLQEKYTMALYRYQNPPF